MINIFFSLLNKCLYCGILSNFERQETLFWNFGTIFEIRIFAFLSKIWKGKKIEILNNFLKVRALFEKETKKWQRKKANTRKETEIVRKSSQIWIFPWI